MADEGGASFWLPGQDGMNLAAVPSSPGWSIPLALYTYVGRAPGGTPAGSGTAVPAGARGASWELSATPTYAPRAKIFGGQSSFGVSVAIGGSATELAATATAAAQSQSVIGLYDVAPIATLAWQRGELSTTLYLTGNLPVGRYSSTAIANLGLNHWAVDGGTMLTWTSATTGANASIVVGVTGNGSNPATNYRNGVDVHVDWSAMLQATPSLQVGATGYYYGQITGDSGSGDACGSCRSRVAGLGMQLNLVPQGAPAGWSLDARGYWEFAARNRLQGHGLFVVLAVPLPG